MTRDDFLIWQLQKFTTTTNGLDMCVSCYVNIHETGNQLEKTKEKMANIYSFNKLQAQTSHYKSQCMVLSLTVTFGGTIKQ